MWLPLFFECYGPALRIVHIKRHNRGRCIDSLVENCTLFPLSYGYYSDSPLAATKRPAAFHFGEQSRAAWLSSSLPDKMAWYYDKTHSLIEQSMTLFEATWSIETERLDTKEVRVNVAAAVGIEDILPSPKHLNSHAFIAGLPEDFIEKAQWLFGRIDIRQAATDDIYPLDYFSNKFIAWTGYQMKRTEHISAQHHRSDAYIGELLDKAEILLERKLTELRNMRKENSQ